jgi:hypothetical protein
MAGVVEMTQTIKTPLKDLYFDVSIYPRENASQPVIDDYAEALSNGKVFPPIIIKKILYIEDGKEIVRNTIIDGRHRYEAMLKFNKGAKKESREPLEEIEATYHDDQVVRSDDGVKKADLIMASARYNAQHGIRLAPPDKKGTARRIYTLNPDFIQQQLADIFGVSQRSVSTWISDLVMAKRASEDSVILKLHLLGWTQEEIGQAVGKSQDTVSLRLRDLEDFLNLVKSLHAKGQGVEKIATDQNIEPALVWAILMDGKDDQTRLEELDCLPRPYDVWNFSDCIDHCGADYPGRIPGQLVLQALYFYTEPGAQVVDPMAGSGTTVDACLLMGRECRAFDSNPGSERKDIVIRDAIEGLAGLKAKADLIFFDPPYFKKVDKGYSDASISRLGRKEYLKFFEDFASTAKKALKKGGRVALLMSDYTEDNLDDSIFLHHYIEAFAKAGFKVERVIQCPLTTQSIHPDIINKFRDGRKLARISRNLVVFDG